MRLSNVSNRFKKLSLLLQIKIRILNIIFVLRIRSYSWYKRYHLIWLFSFFTCFLFKHVIQQARFKTFICDLQSRRQSSQTHLIFRIIQNFNDKLRKKYFLFALINILSKAFYNVNLKIVLFKLETIFNKMFFLL